ncbi:hypothetical protein CPB85DRAFT_1447796 [Mucidula mucida]|nr:hypothetical protein CPB85DRAFT_1447796 [Mucidula mucida]
MGELAATNSKKWALMSRRSQRNTEVVPASSTPGSVPDSCSQPLRLLPRLTNAVHISYVAAQSVTTAHCFVKGVTNLSQHDTYE